MKTKTEEMDILQDKIRELTRKVEELEAEIQHISLPVIPSIMPGTILIPFVGELYPERYHKMMPKILSHVSEHDTEWVVLDFTAISVNGKVSLSVMGEYIQKLAASLQLMGAEVLLVGLAPALSREFVLAGMPFIKELKCFLDFRTALQHLMSVKGLAITKKDPPSERI